MLDRQQWVSSRLEVIGGSAAKVQKERQIGRKG
jgi:hypothetical protein